MAFKLERGSALRPFLTRAQNSWLNPVVVSSEHSRITKVWGEMATDDNGVDKLTVSILMRERPGQPVRLTAKDEFARDLKRFAEDKAFFSFEANLSGSPIPYLFVTALEKCQSSQLDS
jgi:hypothetical protein